MSGSCVVGRRPSGSRNAVLALKDASSMPRRNGSGGSGRPPERTCRQEGQAAATAAAEPARGHAAKKHPQVFCDRPGCYEPVRESPCAPASYCGDDCRAAMNRVRDRERKWLLRKRPAGRIQTRPRIPGRTWATLRRTCPCHGSAAARPAVPPRPLPSAVVHSRSSRRFAAKLQGFSGGEPS